MKRGIFIASTFISLLLPCFAHAFAGDLVLSASNVHFSTNNFTEGKSIRIYASVVNASEKDLLGVVKFFDNNELIKSDQPISALANKEDAVFIDWTPNTGKHDIKIILVPFNNAEDNPANNIVEKEITVLADTDRDGLANINDADDDNDGVKDAEDAFPLDRTESLDSDGDRIGNNKDDDDDNDGVKDNDDALPLDATETLDTDHDGIGNNADTDDDGDGLTDEEEAKKGTASLKPDTDGDSVNDKEDAYPLDPTQARDFDKDGVSDSKDNDADNDGIPKNLDVNDTNLGPEIIITTDKKKPEKIISPGETLKFETTTSVDSDGQIETAEWEIEGKKTSGPILETRFAKPGFHKIKIKLTDDKNESREKVFTVLVAPIWMPWATITAILLIFILAIFLIFSYSKRRL